MRREPEWCGDQLVGHCRCAGEKGYRLDLNGGDGERKRGFTGEEEGNNVVGGAESFIQATPRLETRGSRWTLVSFARTGNAKREPC